MAGTLAQSPVLATAVAGVQNGELHGHRRNRNVSGTSVGLVRVNLSSSSGSALGRRLQSFIGRRRDNLVAMSDSECRSKVPTSRASSSESVSVRDSNSDLSSPSANSDWTESPSNGFENRSTSSLEINKTPAGSQKNLSLAEQLLPSLELAEMKSEPEIPSSLLSKREKSSMTSRDVWAAPGSKLNNVNEVVTRLENVTPTEEAVRAAMEGWDSFLTPKDVATIIPALKWQTALHFFNWVKSEGFGINIVVYNVLLGTFRSGKVWNVANEFAKEMVKEGVQLDNYTYSTLISCALQCSFSEDALYWFQRMDDAGCVPDEVTYSNMALVYSRLRRFDEAMEIYERLRKAGWKPDKVSFGTMVNVFSRAGNYQKALAFIREMQDEGLKPEAVVYNTLIRHFAKEGKLGQAKKVFEDMVLAGVKPSEYTYSLMIDVHGRAGESKEAFRMFTLLKEEKMPLDVVIYNSLLKMCAQEGLVNEGENIFAGMVARGFKPDVVTFKSVINMYSKAGRIKEANKFANRMVEVGLSLDVVVYSCLIKACGNVKDFKRAAQYFDEMLAAGCKPDDKCCGVLMTLMTLCDTEEDRATMVGCLDKAKPILSKVLGLLVADSLDMNELQEQVQVLIDESEVDSQRPFWNSLVDVSWKLGKKDRANHLLNLGESLKIYPGGIRCQTKQLWILNLRCLSLSAGQCALESWINYVREQIDQGQTLPETLVLETGVGRSRDDGGRLFSVILSRLKSIGAPFEPSPERSDWIIASAPAFAAWLAEVREKSKRAQQPKAG